MFAIDTLILVTGVLLLLGIASSKFSARLGVPVLVLFLALGMLAGSDGIGGIEFTNIELAHAIGTIALAFILFDGGLSTPLPSIRSAWRPSFVLATVGVLITAVITAAAAWWLMDDLTWLQALLLGSIVGSTDAAAVFAILRSGGVKLHERLAATLEIESGSNDPMAIFLTVGSIQLITGEVDFGIELLMLFVKQMAIGTLVGLLVGYLAVWIVNRINLATAGLYPVLVSSLGLLIYGLAAWLGGSGFLAVYLAGIVIGNSRLVFQRGIFLFHDAVAWLSQIMMFVVLGLLCFPSQLVRVAGPGLLVSGALILVARPVAVLISLLFSKFNWRELALLSWVGLKGAVPITLATFPLLLNVEGGGVIFNVVFFVVVVSALIQGWTLPLAARLLRLDLPLDPPPPVTLEISSLHHVEGDIVDYTVGPDSHAAGKRVRDLALPEGVVIALIARNEQIIPPQGHTRIEPGDHVVLVLRPGTRPLVNHVFGRALSPKDQLPEMLEFPLRASITIGELEEFYGIRMSAPATCSLGEAICMRLKGEPPTLGTMVQFGDVALHVREIDAEGYIRQVGMVILSEAESRKEESTVDPERAADALPESDPRGSSQSGEPKLVKKDISELGAPAGAPAPPPAPPFPSAPSAPPSSATGAAEAKIGTDTRNEPPSAASPPVD